MSAYRPNYNFPYERGCTTAQCLYVNIPFKSFVLDCSSHMLSLTREHVDMHPYS